MKLKELREQKGISQSQLAKYLGVVRSTVCQYEKGNRQPDTETLIKIANFLNVTVDELIERELITPEERAAGASETKKINITPIEDDLLNIFREIGKKYGEPGQRAALSTLENMLKLK